MIERPAGGSSTGAATRWRRGPAASATGRFTFAGGEHRAAARDAAPRDPRRRVRPAVDVLEDATRSRSTSTSAGRSAAAWSSGSRWTRTGCASSSRSRPTSRCRRPSAGTRGSAGSLATATRRVTVRLRRRRDARPGRRGHPERRAHRAAAAALGRRVHWRHAEPPLTWTGAFAPPPRLARRCSWWVAYTEPEHAVCVEPQSGPPDAVNGASGDRRAGSAARARPCAGAGPRWADRSSRLLAGDTSGGSR